MKPNIKKISHLNISVILHTVGFILLLCVFLSLGFWQLSKAQTKKILYHQIAAFTAASEAQPLTLEEAQSAFNLKGQGASDAHIQTQGELIGTSIILLDNQIIQGKAGYDALVLFKPDESTGRLLLLNLGWHPLVSGARQTKPKIPLTPGHYHITGRLFAPQPDAFVLQKDSAKPQSWPWIIQKPDIALLEKALGHRLYPFILRLETADPDMGLSQLVRAWPARTQLGTSPEKHLGYSIQWFTFALILTGIYLRRLLKGQKSNI